MIQYPALFELDENGSSYNASFPDLEGCLTYGVTLDDAKANEQEALSVYLESLDSRTKEIPDAPRPKGDNVLFVWASYQRIENPRRTNPTLSTIHRLEQVLDFPFFR